MKIIKPNATYLDATAVTPYQHIERIGRTCYKSEDKMTEDSAVRFVSNMKNHKHYAMLEHAHLYLKLAAKNAADFMSYYKDHAELLRFFTVTEMNFDLVYLSASFRAFIEWFDSIGEEDSELCIDAIYHTLRSRYPEMFDENNTFGSTIEPDYHNIVLFENANDFVQDIDTVLNSMTRYQATDKADMANAVDSKKGARKHLLMRHLMHSILFTCDRGVTHELVRHRPASFAQESTRYCNYAKGQFGNEITVIEPFFFFDDNPDNEPKRAAWKLACEQAESQYMMLLEFGATPQEARSVLPNSVKADIIMTANELEWQHILNLRYHGKTGAPHPQMKELMALCYNMLVERSDHRIE